MLDHPTGSLALRSRADELGALVDTYPDHEAQYDRENENRTISVGG